MHTEPLTGAGAERPQFGYLRDLFNASDELQGIDFVWATSIPRVGDIAVYPHSAVGPPVGRVVVYARFRPGTVLVDGEIVDGPVVAVSALRDVGGYDWYRATDLLYVRAEIPTTRVDALGPTD